MLPRIHLKQPNEIQLLLMRNRREVLAEVPLTFIQNISYDLTTYASMSLEIPSSISRGGETLPLPLFDEIKGKQTLILDINGLKSKFIIDDTLTVVETPSGKIKRVSAYGYERSLEKKTFLIGEGATRQLYRPASEEVETSDGILNWFEQQTRWKVGYVDELARKEALTYAKVEEFILKEKLTTQAISKDQEMWSVSLTNPIPANQTFTLFHDEMTAKKGNVEKVAQTFSHTFTLPNAVTKIKATYTSDSVYRYGLTYTFTYSNGKTLSQKTAFTNVVGFTVTIPRLRLTIQTGEMEERLTTKYRFFEQCSTNWYPFLMNEVAEAFDCVFVFNSYTQTIDCYHKDNFGSDSDSGLYLSYENGIKEINKTHKVGEVCTRLYVESPNVSISEENKLGTEYVEDFSFFIKSGLMSDELVNALSRYNAYLDEKQVEWLQLKLEKNKNDQLLSTKQSELTLAQGRYKAEHAILAAYIKAEDKALQEEQSLLVEQIEKEISALLAEIEGENGLQAKSKQLLEQMQAIGLQISKEQATDDLGKIFTDEDLEELDDYIIEGALENDYYTTAHALYQHALTKVKESNEVPIDFSITVANLLDKLIHPEGWQAMFSLGERIWVDDFDVQSEQGFIQLTGYNFNPENRELSDLKFTNNKEPQSSIKTIGDIARSSAQTSNMTNYWKDVWKDAKNNNVHVSKLLEEGLDAAAMAVRSRTSINKIDITEAGIFVSQADDENRQVAIMAGMIALTTDRWKTSQLAVDASGLIADSIIGKLIISEKLVIGNEDNTLALNPDGLSVYDPKASHEERVFIGIRDGKAQLRLFSSNGDKNLVLSEEGIFNVIPISATDNLDIDSPLECNFYLGNNIKSVHEFNLRVKLSKFRGYTKSASTTPSSTTVKTTKSGGSKTYAKSSASGGGASVAKATSMATAWNGWVETTPPQIPGIEHEKHTHAIEIGDWLDHDHQFEFELKEHTHNFTLTTDAHSHEFELYDDGHTHSLEYGIYEYSANPVVNIYLDNLLIASNVSSSQIYDLTDKVQKLSTGWHSVRVEGVAKGANKLGLGRCSIDAYLGAFVSF